MPTLQEKLKLNGKQASVSSEEMANLSNKVGRTVPTTPMEGSVIGGNKDQAKMMGTRQSIQSTLTTNGDDNLQTRMRREQVRRGATAGEQQSMDQADTLANLGSLGERVQTLTQRMINEGAQGDAAALSLGEQGLLQDPETQALLDQLTTVDPSSQEALDLTLQINQKLGRDQQNILSQEELRSNYADITSTTAGQAASNISDQMLVSDIDLTELGFADSNELAGILGIDATELEGETLQSLQQKVDAKLEEEYARMDSLEQITSDPARSAAERAQARKELRAMGAVGIREVESDVDELADQIENADTVDYLGEQYQVADLLDDEVISGLAAKYLDEEGLTGDDWKEQFRTENEELATWLEENKEALSESLSGIDETMMEFADIQNSNRSQIKTSMGQDLDPELADIIVPGWDELSAQRLEGNVLTDILQGEDVLEAGNLLEGIKEMHDWDPELTRELAGLTEDELNRFGVADKSATWNKYQNVIKDLKHIEDIPVQNNEQFFSAMFGKTVDEEQATEELSELIRRQRSGMFGDSAANEFFDQLVGPDGKLLPLEQVNTNLRNQVTPLSIRQYLGNPSKAVSLSDKLGTISSYNQSADSTGLYDRIKEAFNDDTEIGTYEWQQFDDTTVKDVLEQDIPMNDRARSGLIGQYAVAYSAPEMATFQDTNGLILPDNIEKGTPKAQVQQAIDQLKKLLDSKSGFEKESMSKVVEETITQLNSKWQSTRPRTFEGQGMVGSGYLPIDDELDGIDNSRGVKITPSYTTYEAKK